MTEVPKENGIFVDMKIFFVCLALALLLMGFGYFPAQVEGYYSSGLYPVLLTLRLWLTAWVPFSIGDLLYIIVFIYLIYKLIRSLINIKKEIMMISQVPKSPALPTTQPKRKYMITPNIVSKVGVKTPPKVPNFLIVLM